MEVTQARGSNEIESEIDRGELERYTDSEVENHLANNAQARDFAELAGPWDVEVYKAFGEEQITRRYNGKKERPFRNFKEKLKTMSRKSALG